ncbi:MAG: DUF4249 domain-containing protein [Bacteroidetes bacterium]|nr:DUF4249 domain-containing protein [Bacteroidota bacterium]
MNRIIYLILLSIVTMLFSCTEKMDIQLDDTYTRLVVEGRFSTDTTVHKVRLTKTSSYFYNNTALPVSGAIVTISDGVNTILLTENPLHLGVYETPASTYGMIGKTYHLLIKNVDIDGDGVKEEYSANSTIYPINKVDSIAMKYDPHFESWEVKCYVLDPPTEDYYLFNIYKNHVLLTDTITEPLVVDDKMYNGNYTNGIGVGYLRDEKPDEKAFPGDTIELEIWRITKEFQKFVMELQDATRPSTPLFSGPPANVKGNISNGAVGYFTAYSISRCKGVIR